jgi:hypothetical protein
MNNRGAKQPTEHGVKPVVRFYVQAAGKPRSAQLR